MTYTSDPRVDAYIEGLPGWQQDICREVRELIHAADPEVTETIKRSTQPYFVLLGNVCALLAAKDHVNVFLYDGAIVPIPRGSSRGATTTRPPAQSPSARARGSTRPRSGPCSGRSSPTTGPAAGVSSSSGVSAPLIARAAVGHTGHSDHRLPQTSLGPW
jgi:hypothetical protein